MTLSRLAVLSAALLAVAAPALAAGTSTSTLAIKAEVADSCEMQGGSLDFGTYQSGQATDLLIQGTINYANCTAQTVSIEMDGGSSGKESDRTLVNASGGALRYQVYRNFDRTYPWGTGDTALNNRKITATNGSLVVYGKIPGGQRIAGGTYSDVVNVTLRF
ncbi:MAG: spore coat protein U domain-containing protein [Geminicoccaceae bacterium]|nr:spore coat protein U domain-containing protein [Geminicoccaceae bacterium]